MWLLPCFTSLWNDLLCRDSGEDPQILEQVSGSDIQPYCLDKKLQGSSFCVRAQGQQVFSGPVCEESPAARWLFFLNQADPSPALKQKWWVAGELVVGLRPQPTHRLLVSWLLDPDLSLSGLTKEEKTGK